MMKLRNIDRKNKGYSIRIIFSKYYLMKWYKGNIEIYIIFNAFFI